MGGVSLLETPINYGTGVLGYRNNAKQLQLQATMDVMDSKKAVKSPSRDLRLSRFDSQGVHVTWKDDEERQKAEGALHSIETAFSSIIESLGDPNPEREGLKKAPGRAAKALLYFTKGYEEDLKGQ